MNFEDVDRRLRRAVLGVPKGDREYLLSVLTSDDARRAEAIANLYAAGLAPATVEFLIDAEADPALRAVLVGLLREA